MNFDTLACIPLLAPTRTGQQSGYLRRRHSWSFSIYEGSILALKRRFHSRSWDSSSLRSIVIFHIIVFAWFAGVAELGYAMDSKSIGLQGP